MNSLMPPETVKTSVHRDEQRSYRNGATVNFQYVVCSQPIGRLVDAWKTEGISNLTMYGALRHAI